MMLIYSKKKLHILLIIGKIFKNKQSYMKKMQVFARKKYVAINDVHIHFY